MSKSQFRFLSRLRAQHGGLIRALATGAAWLLVLGVSARPALAREAAGLFWQDDFTLGLHRLRWYLVHGWTGRFITHTPMFDPTTQADPGTVDAMQRWLAGDDSTRARMARLYLYARQVHDGRDQANALAGFAQTAQALLPQIAPPDLAARPVKDNHFTLADACAALHSLQTHLNTPWYIISGTFLGAVREGTFLAHDYDVDIGINADDFDEAVFLDTIAAAPDLVFVNQSPARQLEANQQGGWESATWPALYRVLHATGIGIDVFVHHMDGDRQWHGSGKHRWDNSRFALAPCDIAGLTVQGPQDADRYLTENYGDWRTPVTSFNCSTGTPNVSFHRNLSAITEMIRTAILDPGTASAAVAILVLQQEGYLDATRQVFTLPWQESTA